MSTAALESKSEDGGEDSEFEDRDVLTMPGTMHATPQPFDFEYFFKNNPKPPVSQLAHPRIVNDVKIGLVS